MRRMPSTHELSETTFGATVAYTHPRILSENFSVIFYLKILDPAADHNNSPFAAMMPRLLPQSTGDPPAYSKS